VAAPAGGAQRRSSRAPPDLGEGESEGANGALGLAGTARGTRARPYRCRRPRDHRHGDERRSDARARRRVREEGDGEVGWAGWTAARGTVH
jgi:hypothetical protein